MVVDLSSLIPVMALSHMVLLTYLLAQCLQDILRFPSSFRRTLSRNILHSFRDNIAQSLRQPEQGEQAYRTGLPAFYLYFSSWIF